MDLKLFGNELPERHVYLATEGRQYSLKDIKREFGSWNSYVLEFSRLVAEHNAKQAVVIPAKVVTNVATKQTT